MRLSVMLPVLVLGFFLTLNSRLVADPPAPDRGAPAAETLGDFTVLGKTDQGQTLFIKLPSPTTIETAITQTAASTSGLSAE